ncbi:unnamed protein product [Orchesella dallaii]|uniref:Winged helix Storkhead-box1 domain-containing protein n=1 Tax=Orchesella dallaii TaxID=48710 RepID=A0ABP1R1U0_9HEXA
MAPLFGQRQKVPEELATTSQCPPHASSSSGGTLSSATMDSHSQCMNTCRAHHSANPHPSSGSRNGHHHRQEAPPPLPLRQTGANDTCQVISGDTTAIRKYLVLLQDCLAIKFAPLVNGHQSHPYPFSFTSNKNCNSGHNCTSVDDEDDPLVSHRPTDLHHQRVSANSSKGGSNSINESHSNSRNSQSNHLSNHNSNNHPQHNHFPLGNNAAGIHNNEDPQQAFHLQNHHKSSRPEQFHFLQSSSRGGTANRPSASSNGVGAILGSNTAEVDHSLHGLYLYKGFKEANIQCYWNSALSETFKNIQYKGYIVPSTILVGALPKFLSILRTAWSRQMLRSPAGYRIEFIGEIEEVIADPIQKGQFAPLSDSLCWAILELTSLGQEAFVDSIMSALQLTFPTMSCPSRELVFQTLEKLIKERKVYQTSRGYFVVTPDIFRYMISANFHNAESSPSFPTNHPGLTLDALLHPNCHEHDKMSFSHQSWDSAVSTGDHNRCSSTSTGEELIVVAPSPKLKRHNSLKTIRQRDVAVTQMSASTGQRRHSLRLPKSKSCGRMNDSIDDDEEVKTAKVKSSTLEHISRAMRSLRTGASNTSNHDGGAGDAEKGKKNKSLLSKLFPFRRSNSKPRNEKITATTTTTKEATKPASGSTTSSTSTSNCSMSPPTNSKHSGNVKDSAKFISTQTQTSNSTEQLCAPSITLSSSRSSHPPAASVPTGSTEKNSGRLPMESSTPENSSDMDGCILHQDCINGDGSHQTRSSSRRSMSMLDESPLYDVLQDVPNISGINHISPNFQVGCPVAPPTFPGFHRGESSRCSTLSSQAASSLGYGSQGHPSHLNTYSPNLDSGLASYGYYGDSSMSNSHSPCPSTGAYCSPSAHYGYNNRNNNCNTIFPQPAKPTAYSSARYKSSYEWYRKRYPNYISPVGRSSPLYASLTAPRTKSRSRPTYESLLTPMDEKHGGGLVQMVENHRCPSASQQNGNANKTTMPVNSTMSNNTNDAQGSQKSSTNTTTVTQAVKSTTNMELELLLPLGKIMKAALNAKKDAIRDAWLRDDLGPGYAAYADRYKLNQGATSSSNNNEPIKVNLDNTGAKLRVGEPSTKTEVTTVVNNNGVIETHFDSSSGANQPMFDLGSPNMKSTVEIKTLGGVTDVVLVNGKTGEETKILPTTNNSQEKGQSCAKQHVSSGSSTRSKSNNGIIINKNNNSYEKILDKRSPSSCVKISDIGKDSGADEDFIKGC